MNTPLRTLLDPDLRFRPWEPAQAEEESPSTSGISKSRQESGSLQPRLLEQTATAQTVLMGPYKAVQNLVGSLVFSD